MMLTIMVGGWGGGGGEWEDGDNNNLSNRTRQIHYVFRLLSDHGLKIRNKAKAKLEDERPVCH